MLPIPKFYKYLTGIDIAFVDGGLGLADTITQVAAQFVVAGFVAGDSFVVTGSTSNDGTYTIVSVVAGTITLATATLTAEIAGDTVVIKSELTAFAFGNCDAGDYAPSSTGLIIHLYNDIASAGSDDLTYIKLSVRDSDGNETELWTTNRWIEVKSSGGDATVDDAMTEYKQIGKNHPLTLGDIQTGKYRILYVRLHGPTSAQEGDLALQLIVNYNDSVSSTNNQMIHFQDLKAASATHIHAAITGNGASQDITTNITNPDVPRVASITATNNATIPTGVVTITGLVRGVSTTDAITITGGSTVNGVKPFDTITNINIPAGVDVNNTVSIGIGDVLGLPKEINLTSDVYKKSVNSVDVTTEISGKVNATYGTLDCSTIVANEETTIWYLADY